MATNPHVPVLEYYEAEMLRLQVRLDMFDSYLGSPNRDQSAVPAMQADRDADAAELRVFRHEYGVEKALSKAWQRCHGRLQAFAGIPAPAAAPKQLQLPASIV